MSSCGGVVTINRVTVGSDSTQVVGSLEARQRLTIRANPSNAYYIYLTTDQAQGWREGFPLYPGEAYTFDGPGAKAAVFALSSGPDNLAVNVITETA